ncbi:MAG TPA: ATP-binding protein [Prolixibacteraceae bacterium]|nr:ATP-binding protein [Prolixibacteraceae bacterium]HPR60525.1 ATP-binding protein [Prolixibacteraceae bacterium]
MFIRSQIQIIEKRLNEPRKYIQVIVGPRQVGKSTLVSQLLEKISMPHTFESADGVANINTTWLQQIWESARLIMSTTGAKEHLLVIDEIQKIDNWSETIKQQWDKDSREGVNIKVIILGSSRLLIQKGLSESLAGRFEVVHMGHWSYAEMNEAFGFNLNQFIYFGGYPGAASLIDDEKRWRNYINDSLIETSISKDILMMTRVDKPALLKRLFELGSLYSGQILSFTKMIGELQDAGNTTTLSHYLSLLTDSGLLAGIEKYAGNVIRRRSSSPKFQVFNNALLSAQSPDRFSELQLDPAKWGRLVESAVGAHLINQSVSERFQLYYWREGSNEVDFVLMHSGKTIAIEVKSGVKAVNPGMDLFAQKFKPVKVLMVGSAGIPLDTFLKIKPTDLF